MEDFARVEYCVMDKSDNNVEVFTNEKEAIKYAQDKHYARVLEVGYGEPDEYGDENELYAEEIWSIDEDFVMFEGTAYYDVKFSGVADVIETNEYSEIEAWAWNMLQQGLYVEVKNMKSGKSQRLTPDDIDDNGLDMNIEESLHEEIEVDSLKLANTRVKPWYDLYLDDICGGDEEEFRDLYYNEEDDDYWQEPCQVAFDVVDGKGHKICTLTVYKFDGMGMWYEIGLSEAIPELEGKLELQDLDVNEDGWFDESYNNKNLVNIEDYEKMVEPHLIEIAQALK